MKVRILALGSLVCLAYLVATLLHVRTWYDLIVFTISAATGVGFGVITLLIVRIIKTEN